MQLSRKMFELKTSAKHSALFSLFSHVVTGDDPEVTAAKPAPIIYSVARARFPQQSGPGPQCLVFEVGEEAIQIISTNIFTSIHFSRTPLTAWRLGWGRGCRW